jgi:hypothetical protein
MILDQDSKAILVPSSKVSPAHGSKPILDPAISMLRLDLEPASKRILEASSLAILVPTSKEILVPTSKEILVPTSKEILVPTSLRILVPSSLGILVPTSKEIQEPSSKVSPAHGSKPILDPAISMLRLDLEPASKRILEASSLAILVPTS